MGIQLAVQALDRQDDDVHELSFPQRHPAAGDDPAVRIAHDDGRDLFVESAKVCQQAIRRPSVDLRDHFSAFDVCRPLRNVWPDTRSRGRRDDFAKTRQTVQHGGVSQKQREVKEQLSEKIRRDRIIADRVRDDFLCPVPPANCESRSDEDRGKFSGRQSFRFSWHRSSQKKRTEISAVLLTCSSLSAEGGT